MKNENSLLNQIISKKIDIPNENFFEEIATTILSDEKQITKTIPFYKKPIFKWLSAAAMLIPIVIYISFYTRKQQGNKIVATLNTLSKEEIRNYLLSEEKVLVPLKKQVVQPRAEKDKNPEIAQQTSTNSVDPFKLLNNEDIKAYLLFESIEQEEDETETFI